MTVRDVLSKNEIDQCGKCIDQFLVLPTQLEAKLVDYYSAEIPQNRADQSWLFHRLNEEGL